MSTMLPICTIHMSWSTCTFGEGLLLLVTISNKTKTSNYIQYIILTFIQKVECWRHCFVRLSNIDPTNFGPSTHVGYPYVKCNFVTWQRRGFVYKYTNQVETVSVTWRWRNYKTDICSPDLRSLVIGRICDKTASSQVRHLVTKDECSGANDIIILNFLSVFLLNNVYIFKQNCVFVDHCCWSIWLSLFVVVWKLWRVQRADDYNKS